MSSRTFLRTSILLVGLAWAYWQAPTAVQRLRAWWSPQRASAAEVNPARDAAWEDLKRQARKRQEAKALAKQHKSPQAVTDMVLYSPDPKGQAKEARTIVVTPAKRPRTASAPPPANGKPTSPEPDRKGEPARPASNSPASDLEGDAAAARSEAASEPSVSRAGGALSNSGGRDHGAGEAAGVAVSSRSVGDALHSPFRAIGRAAEPIGSTVFQSGQPDLAALWSGGGPYALRAYAGRVRLFAVIGPVGSACGPALYEPSGVADGAAGTDDGSMLP